MQNYTHRRLSELVLRSQPVYNNLSHDLSNEFWLNMLFPIAYVKLHGNYIYLRFVSDHKESFLLRSNCR